MKPKHQACRARRGYAADARVTPLIRIKLDSGSKRDDQTVLLTSHPELFFLKLGVVLFRRLSQFWSSVANASGDRPRALPSWLGWAGLDAALTIKTTLGMFTAQV
jgi:hypothetical protein